MSELGVSVQTDGGWQYGHTLLRGAERRVADHSGRNTHDIHYLTPLDPVMHTLIFTITHTDIYNHTH